MSEEAIAATVAALTEGEPEAAREAPEAAKPAEPAEAAKPEAPKPESAEPAAPAGERANPSPEAGGDKNAITAAEEEAYKAFAPWLGERCSSAAQMKMQLADAHVLYDICDGKQHPRVLLDMAKEIYPATYAAMREYFAKEAGEPVKPATGEAKPAEGKEGKTSVEERLDKIERERERGEFRQRAEKTTRSFVTKVQELGKAANLGEKRLARFSDHISAAIGRDPAALKRLEGGNFVDVERMFNELHNEFVEDLQAHNKGLVESKQARDRALPKTPAGGAPPAASGAGKPKTRDERIAAVTAGLTE